MTRHASTFNPAVAGKASDGQPMTHTQEYGTPISLADAKQVASSAELEATAHGWAVVVAIVGSSGHLVLLRKMDQAQYGSIDVAQAKANTALNFKRPSKTFEDALARGGLHLRLLATDGICPLEGGLPLIQNGRIVGAIGVSGAQSNEDGQVAMVGASAIGGQQTPKPAASHQ